MALYQNVAPQYEVYMLDPNREYETISSHIGGSYEEMRPLEIGDNLSRKHEKISKRPLRAVYMLIGCIIGLVFGILLGAAAATYAIQCNKDQKTVKSATVSIPYALAVVTSPDQPVRSETSTFATLRPAVSTSSTEDTVTNPQTNTAIATSSHADTTDNQDDHTWTTRTTLTKNSETEKEEKAIATTQVTEDEIVGVTSDNPRKTLQITNLKADFPCDVKVEAICYCIKLKGHDRMDFRMAESICQEMGGHVARIPSEGAYRDITGKMRSLDVNHHRAVTAWIGEKVDTETGVVLPQFSQDYVKWGPYEPNTGGKFIHHTHVYIYVDEYDTKYVGMRNLAPNYNRDGVVCQNVSPN